MRYRFDEDDVGISKLWDHWKKSNPVGQGVDF